MPISEEDADSHELPAVKDWPRGFGEASWWPFVTAIGAAGLYAGAGLWLLGQGGSSPVQPVIGPAIIVTSTLLLLGGLYGWLYHAFVGRFWTGDGTGDERKFRWGMLLFLGSELATFGAGFAYYFFIRAGVWPPGGLPHLLSSLVLVNTGILIASSVTLHLAHVELRKGNRRRFLGSLGATLVLGVIFLAGQLLEYYQFIVTDGFTLSSGIYFSAFYGLTGLHGLHVTLGIVLLGIVLARGVTGQYTADRHASVSTASMYWHFVDAVWIFLVVTLYVGATISL